MGYVPKDRDKQALMVSDSIEDNVCLAAVDMTQGRMGFLSPRRRQEVSSRVVKKFDVKTKGITQVISGLSGGNRQKVNLGRWMIQDKEVLILDCPTRGVDVGVKSYIYRSMMEAKKQGSRHDRRIGRAAGADRYGGYPDGDEGRPARRGYERAEVFAEEK